jgi:cyclopropane-fatty-acyl-phospholipid synthase
MSRYQQILQSLAEQAGITVNGSGPCDIQVHNEKFYERVISQGSLGLGESYMDGWWSCEQLDEFFYKLLRAHMEQKLDLTWRQLLGVGRAKLMNMQSLKRAEEVAKVHYNLNTEFFAAILDPRMVYSCGYWRNAENLERAQEAKLDLICRKLNLSSHDRILDVGCGWGSFLKFAYERYKCRSIGVTISAPQADYARASCAGMPIEVIKCDYRDVGKESHGQFTKVVSIGMFEHVGPKNYRRFMEVVDELLTGDGLFLLHTIGDNYSRTSCDPWLDKYIFPNGVAPSVAQLGKAIEGIFVMEDWHNFGPDYYATLLCWNENLKRNLGSTTVDTLMPRDKFLRMWEYFFTSFASAFKAKHLQLWQIVMSKGHSNSVYPSVR